MRFEEFAQVLERLEETSSRTDMTVLLSDFLKKLSEEEVRPVMYMLIGRVTPSYASLEFNFSRKLLLRSLQEGFGVEEKVLEDMLSSMGDIGLVAQEVVGVAQDGKLEVVEVYDRLFDMANLEGRGSQEEKMRVFVDLAKALDPLGVRYVARIITGKLRLGLSEKTILDSISWAMTGDKSMRKMLDRAYGVRADIGLITEYALSSKLEVLESLKIQVGVPIASKLVEREKSVEAVFDRMPKSIVQPKYDGLRTQVHFSRTGFEVVGKKEKVSQMGFDMGQKHENVRVFSRNMESLTDMFPDIVASIQKLGVDSIVLDAESIGYDPSSDKFIPFQETIRRRRKYGVREKAEEFPVRVFVFDVLFLNGEDLSQRPFVERVAILERVLSKTGYDYDLDAEVMERLALPVDGDQDVLEMARSTLVEDATELDDLFRGYLDKGLEGVIVKDLESVYVPGTRTYDWIKLKANIESDLIDTVDCVVLGYYYGRGARAKFGAGAFLVGVLNKEEGRFESIAKVGSGIKDEEWEGYVQDVERLRVDSLPDDVYVKKELVPDVVCEPEIVVVVDADEITKSKNHTAGSMDSSGYSLRFPRLKQWGRPDKGGADITTVEEIEKMYSMRQN